MSIEHKPEYNTENLEEILVHKFNLKIIKPPESFEVPKNINYHALESLGIEEENVKNMVRDIARFINLPIIIDSFDKDHMGRREWRKKIEADYGEGAISFLKANKLRINSFAFISLAWGIIDLYARNKPPTPELDKINSLRGEYQSAINGYKDMGVEEKIATVRTLDELLKKFLSLLEIQ